MATEDETGRRMARDGAKAEHEGKRRRCVALRGELLRIDHRHRRRKTPLTGRDEEHVEILSNQMKMDPLT